MEKVKIKNIFDFQKKSKIKAGDGFKLGEAQYPFYTSSNELTKSINEYLFEDESLIFGTGGLASIHFCNEKFAVSTDCFVIQPKDKKRVFSKFVYYYLSGNMNILENGFKGAGLKHISKDYLENIEIPLPNLATQQRIAAILDQADAIIQNNRAIVQKYDALTQSLFLDMFGDPVRNEKGWEKDILKNVCTKITDGTHDTPERLNKGIKFITGKHIKPFFVDYENSDYVTKEIHMEIYKRCNPEFEDILYTNIGVNFATAALNVVDYEFSMKNVALLKYKRNIINGYYLTFLLNNANFKDRLKKAFGIGGAQQFLSLSNIKKIEIHLPPIQLQNQFAERVAMIEAQKQQAQLELAKSEELFASLLQRAFKGELN